MKKLIKKAILILFISLLPACAGNPTGNKWAKPIVQYQLDTDIPITYSPSNLQLKNVPQLQPSPLCFNCIKINYIDKTNNVPARSFVISSKGQIISCQIDVFNNYQGYANPEIAYKNFIDHEMIHCLGGGHTATFTGFPFPPSQQPLMASVGRTISPGLSFDDKNLLWEIYDAKLKYGKQVKIKTARQFDNIFLVKKTQKKYSLSKYGSANTTFFYNVLPGEYYIGVRGDKELKWICQEEGKGFELCNQPHSIWIQKNKRIEL